MAESGEYTPETLSNRQRIANQLLLDSAKPREIRSRLQGMGQLGEGLIAGLMSRGADQEQKEGTAATAAAWASLLDKNGGGGGAIPAVAGALNASPVTPTNAGPVQEVNPADFNSIDALASPAGKFDPNYAPTVSAANRAVASVESGGSGGYSALGPETGGDRAYGKHQVMGKNVGPWTEEVLGKRLDPQAFLANPDAQDAVFNAKFGGNVQKYGNVTDPASIWFSGKPVAEAGNRSDVLGTTVPSYVQKVSAALGPAAGASQPAAGAPGQTAPLPAPSQVAQNAPASPAGAQGGMAERVAAMLRDPKTDPRALPGLIGIARALAQKKMDAENPSFGFQTLPDGTIIRTDPKSGTVQPIYQAATKPTWGVVSEKDGEKVHGWIDSNKKSVDVYTPPGGGNGPTPITGPDGKPIAVPPGVDPKEFRKRVTESVADAAVGKKTEVQAKDEKFANKMELAEKNITGLEGEGQSMKGRALEGSPYLPGSSSIGNKLQSENYQLYKQGRDNFITALLRDESGAAIGTPEFDRYEKELFPQPGDGPKVVEQKRDARRIAIEGMKKGAGPGYKAPTAAPSAAAPIKVATPEEAAKLPKGTAIILPDGSPGVVP